MEEGMRLLEVESFEGVKNAFFFIPDISGFTRFINSSPIEESRHIISGLLNSVLDSNILNLKVAEIEGDAVVFYSLDTIPDLIQLEYQAKKTFSDFHQTLQNYKKQNYRLNGLTLKIIVHYGKVVASDLRGITKLIGSDIILAHRILKNNIHEDEYLLMTKNYLNTQQQELIDKTFLWSEYKEGIEQYEYFGQIEFSYIRLSPLKHISFSAIQHF